MPPSPNTGVSAVIDGRGRLVHAIALNTAGFFDAPLPPALSETLYSRIGDKPVGLLLLVLLAALILARGPEKD